MEVWVSFLLSTIYYTVMKLLFTNLFSGVGVLTYDLFLSALAGGALMAVGMGLVFRAGATTGGMDIVVKLPWLKIPHMKTRVLFPTTDIAVVTVSAILFRDIERTLYASFAVFITSVVLDVVLYGGNGAKLITSSATTMRPSPRGLWRSWILESPT